MAARRDQAAAAVARLQKRRAVIRYGPPAATPRCKDAPSAMLRGHLRASCRMGRAANAGSRTGQEAARNRSTAAPNRPPPPDRLHGPGR